MQIIVEVKASALYSKNKTKIWLPQIDGCQFKFTRKVANVGATCLTASKSDSQLLGKIKRRHQAQLILAPIDANNVNRESNSRKVFCGNKEIYSSKNSYNVYYNNGGIIFDPIKWFHFKRVTNHSIEGVAKPVQNRIMHFVRLIQQLGHLL